MRYLILAVLLVGCRDPRLGQASDCGKRCYPEGWLPKEGVVTGECNYGHYQCEDDGGMECVDWVPPAREECDGLDNDCNGEVDDLDDSPRLCSTACGNGTEQCINAHWSPCSAPKPKPEICNGRDDDCDLKVDEADDLRTKDGGTDFSCFTGPPGASALGICHGGSIRCVGGQETCFGQQLPISEVCNGYDDDCDGQIDEGATKNEVLDLVLVFDNSGSMSGVAANLKLATQNWVNKYAANTERHYALVVAPDIDVFIAVPRAWTDFGDAASLAQAMSEQNGTSGSGQEPTLDALDEILLDMTTPTLPKRDGGTGLSWRTGSHRAIVMFSDEHPQSYRNGCNDYCPSLMSSVAARLTMTGIPLFVFTSTSEWSEWLMLSSPSGGLQWPVNDSTTQLEMNLDAVLRTTTCSP